MGTSGQEHAVATGHGDAVLSEHPLPHIYGNGESAKVSLVDYLLAIREGDVALQEERDRRYTELAIEKEKALKIKETADLAALALARDIQTYKDEKANELREQIANERGIYVTRSDIESLRRFTITTMVALVAILAAAISTIALVFHK
jgi:hypothetical protein